MEAERQGALARGRDPQGVIVCASALAAAMTGVVASRHPTLALGGTCLVAYAVLVLVDFPVAIAVWAALTSLSGLRGFGVAHTAASLLLLLAWLIMLAAGRDRARWEGFRRGRRGRAAFRSESQLFVPLAILLAWITLSVTWADDPVRALDALWQWYAAALTVLVLATTLQTPRDVRLVVVGLTTGIVLSVVLGLTGVVAPWTPPPGPTGITVVGDRLQGAAGDPNFLAASIVPAALAAIAIAATAGRAGKALVAVAIGVLVVGLAATESRGGLVAAVGACVLAVVVLRTQRRSIATGIVVVAAGFLMFSLVAHPISFNRITSFSDEGNGRTELWKVAERVTAAHPVQGVGLANFTVQSPHYVRRPGSLQFVNLIADKPHEAHNTYLQLLAETGIVGLAAFLAVIFASVRAATAAARRFERLGDKRLALFTRACAVALGGMLIAVFFITAWSDLVLWVLIGLGPALWTVSTGMRPVDGVSPVGTG